MDDAPCAPVARRIEPGDVARLVHRRVGDTPDERGHGEIRSQEDDGIRQRRNDELRRPRQHGDVADPARQGPDQPDDQERDRAQEHAGARRRGRAQPRPALRVDPRFQDTLCHVPEAFPAERVSRLYGDGIERPEASLGRAEQRPAPQPPDRDDQGEQQKRPETGERGGEPLRDRREPSGRDERREAQQDAGQNEQEQPGREKPRKAYLRQQAAGDGEQRAPLGARRVVLDVAPARVNERRHR